PDRQHWSVEKCLRRTTAPAETIGVIPETHYAKTVDGVHIAYQVLGSGPMDLVFMHGFVTNLEAVWQWPVAAAYLRRLATFSRVLIFDRRGTGLSDHLLPGRSQLEGEAQGDGFRSVY